MRGLPLTDPHEPLPTPPPCRGLALSCGPAPVPGSAEGGGLVNTLSVELPGSCALATWAAQKVPLWPASFLTDLCVLEDIMVLWEASAVTS